MWGDYNQANYSDQDCFKIYDHHYRSSNDNEYDHGRVNYFDQKHIDHKQSNYILLLVQLFGDGKQN